jgi:hypothetical protein
VVALISWFAAALFAPLHTDNRPRLDELAAPDFEPDTMRELLAAGNPRGVTNGHPSTSNR